MSAPRLCAGRLPPGRSAGLISVAGWCASPFRNCAACSDRRRTAIDETGSIKSVFYQASGQRCTGHVDVVGGETRSMHRSCSAIVPMFRVSTIDTRQRCRSPANMVTGWVRPRRRRSSTWRGSVTGLPDGVVVIASTRITGTRINQRVETGEARRHRSHRRQSAGQIHSA